MSLAERVKIVSDFGQAEIVGGPMDGVHREADGLTTWPDSFPANCPPEDAVSADGEFYRLVRNAPPTPDDFRNHHERLAAGELKKRRWSDDCAAAGLSVFGDASEAAAVAASNGAMKSWKAAKGNLDGSGLMKHTPSRSRKDSTHHTWWRPVGDVEWSSFQVAM